MIGEGFGREAASRNLRGMFVGVVCCISFWGLVVEVLVSSSSAGSEGLSGNVSGTEHGFFDFFGDRRRSRGVFVNIGSLSNSRENSIKRRWRSTQTDGGVHKSLSEQQGLFDF